MVAGPARIAPIQPQHPTAYSTAKTVQAPFSDRRCRRGVVVWKSLAYYLLFSGNGLKTTA